MEKSILEKHGSIFGKNGHFRHSPRTSHSVSFSDDAFEQHSRNSSNVVESFEDNLSDAARAQISREVAQFTDILWADHDKSSAHHHIPDSMETFLKIVQVRIARYNSGDPKNMFGKKFNDDSFFIESVRRISKLTNALSEYSSDSGTNPSLNRSSVVLQRAMAFLEEEFRVLLDDSRNSSDNLSKFVVSFNSKNQLLEYSDRCVVVRQGEGDDYPAYSPLVVEKMHEIASTMIFAGYEMECCNLYSICRVNAIRNEMKKMEYEKINMEDAVRMPWELLETEVWKWIKVVKKCSEVIFPGEKKLGDSVFSDHLPISRNMFSNLVRAVAIHLLDFAEATTMATRSAEKLFKFLDMYEILQSLIQAINGSTSDESCIEEITATVDRVGEFAANNFCELENSIKCDVARAPVPGGAVHPLVRYVMNYLEYAWEYKDSLHRIFEKLAVAAEGGNKPIQQEAAPRTPLSPPYPEQEIESPHFSDTAAPPTPFSYQVVTVMDLLDSNLEEKSKLYRDPALRYVFLMNNGRYILQKVKKSTEIRQVLGDNWCRRKSTVVRQYHKNYIRETWNRVLQSLSHDGLMNNGKINKPLLKERFKNFAIVFDEILRTQSTWMVADDQLKSELRISISALVVPAYRSFVGRFRQHLDSGRQAEKYIKYQPEDIETLVEDLFEGSTHSMTRRRT